MRIRLDGDRRERMIRSIQGYFDEHFDETLSDFRAEQILDFFVRELGPPVYNQAIRDAHAFIQDKLVDLEGEHRDVEKPVEGVVAGQQHGSLPGHVLEADGDGAQQAPQRREQQLELLHGEGPGVEGVGAGLGHRDDPAL